MPQWFKILWLLLVAGACFGGLIRSGNEDAFSLAFVGFLAAFGAGLHVATINQGSRLPVIRSGSAEVAGVTTGVLGRA